MNYNTFVIPTPTTYTFLFEAIFTCQVMSRDSKAHVM